MASSASISQLRGGKKNQMSLKVGSGVPSSNALLMAFHARLSLEKFMLYIDVVQTILEDHSAASQTATLRLSGAAAATGPRAWPGRRAQVAPSVEAEGWQQSWQRPSPKAASFLVCCCSSLAGM